MLQRSLAQGQKPYLQIRSGSMAPLLRPGDEIQLEPLSLERLQPGDLITLAGPGALLTHRFWGLLEREGQPYLLTRGDRTLAFDPPHPAGALLGRVTGRRRANRLLSLERGSGRWLHRRLVRAAALDISLFVPLAEGSRPPLPRSRFSGTFRRKEGRSLQVRLLRRLLWSWTVLLTALADGLAPLTR
jgi:hypothetical protein